MRFYNAIHMSQSYTTIKFAYCDLIKNNLIHMIQLYAQWDPMHNAISWIIYNAISHMIQYYIQSNSIKSPM